MNDYDHKLLDILRENVILGPIDYLRVLKQRIIDEDNQSKLNELDECNLPVDYSISETLEFALRYKKWIKSTINSWSKYGRHMNFEEYALIMLMNLEEENNEKQYRLFK